MAGATRPASPCQLAPGRWTARAAGRGLGSGRPSAHTPQRAAPHAYRTIGNPSLTPQRTLQEHSLASHLSRQRTPTGPSASHRARQRNEACAHARCGGPGASRHPAFPPTGPRPAPSVRYFRREHSAQRSARSCIRSATSRPRPRSRVRRGARERGAQRVLIANNNLVGSVFMTFMSTTNNSTPGEARRRLVRRRPVSAPPRQGWTINRGVLKLPHNSFKTAW